MRGDREPTGPDQGNHYELAGVVAELDVLALLASAHPGAHLVPLDAPGFGLVPVTAELAGTVTPAMICAVLEGGILGGPQATGRPGAAWVTGPESGFHRLNPGLLAMLEAVSAAGPVAYLEADYIGRDGRQTAALWRAGALLVGPLLLGRGEPFDAEAAPISRVLRRLGMPRRGSRDEFVTAGLGRCRRTEDWP